MNKKRKCIRKNKFKRRKANMKCGKIDFISKFRMFIEKFHFIGNLKHERSFKEVKNFMVESVKKISMHS